MSSRTRIYYDLEFPNEQKAFSPLEIYPLGIFGVDPKYDHLTAQKSSGKT